MRSKILLSVLVIALAAALLAGATGAWFTDTATLGGEEGVTFTAGTVVISADGPNVVLEDITVGNVNPGDTTEVCWEIINDGTKDAVIRAQIEETVNLAVAGDEETEGAIVLTPQNSEDWVLSGGYYYYTGTLQGDFGKGGDWQNASTKLCFNLQFVGAKMGNEYQGATYTIGGTVDAVQASNNAPSIVWEVNYDEIVGGTQGD